MNTLIHPLDDEYSRIALSAVFGKEPDLPAARWAGDGGSGSGTDAAYVGGAGGTFSLTGQVYETPGGSVLYPADSLSQLVFAIYDRNEIELASATFDYDGAIDIDADTPAATTGNGAYQKADGGTVAITWASFTAHLDAEVTSGGAISFSLEKIDWATALGLDGLVNPIELEVRVTLTQGGQSSHLSTAIIRKTYTVAPEQVFVSRNTTPELLAATVSNTAFVVEPDIANLEFYHSGNSFGIVLDQDNIIEEDPATANPDAITEPGGDSRWFASALYVSGDIETFGQSYFFRQGVSTNQIDLRADYGNTHVTFAYPNSLTIKNVIWQGALLAAPYDYTLDRVKLTLYKGGNIVLSGTQRSDGVNPQIAQVAGGIFISSIEDIAPPLSAVSQDDLEFVEQGVHRLHMEIDTKFGTMHNICTILINGY